MHPFKPGWCSTAYAEKPKSTGDGGPIYEAKRDRLLRGLEGTGFTWVPAEGGYFQVVGVSAYLKPGETDGDLARRWTREHGIATIPMDAFGRQWEPAVRLCFAKEDHTNDDAISRLKAIPVERQTTVPTSTSGRDQGELRQGASAGDGHPGRFGMARPRKKPAQFEAVLEKEWTTSAADVVVLLRCSRRAFPWT